MFVGSGLVIMDIVPLNPVTEGHRIVFSDNHVENFMEDAKETAFVMKYAAERAEMLVKEHGYEGMNLITSAGEAATQTVPHFHVHLVPRRKGDNLKLPWSGQKKHE